MAQEQHIKIISQTAKKMLKPFGITQKGQSRVWIDDKGWFSTIIEFQPSNWAKGSYLNVGVNFHWYKQDYLSFDIGGRENNFYFVEYKNDEQFTTEIESFCERIIEKVLMYRETFTTTHLAKVIILKTNFTDDELWANYHKGIICGLTGDFDGLNKFFGDLLKMDSTQQWTDGNTGATHSTHIQWIEDLKENVKYLLSKTTDLELFQSEILKIILETRKMKKLPEIEIGFEK